MKGVDFYFLEWYSVINVLGGRSDVLVLHYALCAS